MSTRSRRRAASSLVCALLAAVLLPACEGDGDACDCADIIVVDTTADIGAGPEPTAMVHVVSGLTFTFGDEDLCQSAQSEDDLGRAIDCDDVRSAGEGESFQVAKAWPVATVVLGPFAIDAHEVTNAQYQRCVDQGECGELMAFNAANIIDYYRNPTYADHPVLNATWEQARAFCAAQGKRLPTQFEWERAAGGPTLAADGTSQDPTRKRRYPWADDTDTASACQGQALAVAFCGAQRDPIGVTAAAFDRVQEGGQTLYGFAGNVSEWVLDYRVEDLTCREDLNCPDCWSCTTQACFEACYSCDECWSAGDACYALCGAEDAGVFRGYPVCFRYQEPLYCAVDVRGESECCLGNFAGENGTDCAVAEPADRLRAYRGGNYLTTAPQSCTLRSADGSQGFQADQPQQRVGFRCARSL